MGRAVLFAESVVPVADILKVLFPVPSALFADKTRSALGADKKAGIPVKRPARRRSDVLLYLQCIEIVVPAYPVGISYKGVYHYRSGSTKQVLNGPSLEAFLMRKHGATWDNMPLPVFKMSDVDDNAVNRFKELAAGKGRKRSCFTAERSRC